MKPDDRIRLLHIAEALEAAASDVLPVDALHGHPRVHVGHVAGCARTGFATLRADPPGAIVLPLCSPVYQVPEPLPPVRRQALAHPVVDNPTPALADLPRL